MPKMELGSSSYDAVEEFPGNQIPTGKEVIGRMMYLTSKEVRHTVVHSTDSAAMQVVKEVQDICIYSLNIYPMADENIKKKVIQIYQEADQLSKG